MALLIYSDSHWPSHNLSVTPPAPVVAGVVDDAVVCGADRVGCVVLAADVGASAELHAAASPNTATSSPSSRNVVFLIEWIKNIVVLP
jgi:hypothetical protein